LDYYNGDRSKLIGVPTGIGAGIALGYGLSDVLSIEARFTYKLGREVRLETGDGVSTFRRIETWKSTYFRIDPAIRPATPDGAVRGYVAVGPSLAIAPTIAYTDRWSINNSTDNYSSSHYEDVQGGIGFGGFGALGLLWNHSSGLGVFGEAQFTAMNWTPQKSTYTGLNSTGVYSGTVNFVDIANPDNDNEEAKIHVPMSTWGLRIGLRYSFGS